ncbi:DnaJ domain-containing protein [Lophiotrema nucula]|uniref:DnaJ domain-containing protein n=1 Tax=Lophiotrema nucula TaxID=690887 RepID=A0A6A5ZRH1_9PLEO|nr:DnaJ domain-containing protein [Lophiotrema nucula]
MRSPKRFKHYATVPDYYAALGVDYSASATEIKAAFRRLALKHHPDKKAASGDNNAVEFRQVSTQLQKVARKLNESAQAREAYEKLSDPVTKAAYDSSYRQRPALPSWFNPSPPHKFNVPPDTPLRAKPKRQPGETSKTYYASPRYLAWLSSLQEATSGKMANRKGCGAADEEEFWMGGYQYRYKK